MYQWYVLDLVYIHECNWVHVLYYNSFFMFVQLIVWILFFIYLDCSTFHCFYLNKEHFLKCYPIVKTICQNIYMYSAHVSDDSTPV